MVLRHEFPAVEARRFLQSLPRTRSRSVAWATPVGRGLRLASKPDDAAVCLAGPERLRLLEKLLPYAKALRVYGPPPTGLRVAEPSAWELALDGARVVFALSPELFRGFSGEGGVLSELGAADDEVVEEVAEHLHGEPEIDAGAVASVLGLARTAVQTALAALGAAGRVGFDLGGSAYFHRELPYERAVLEAMHPRLFGARELAEQGAVRFEDGSAIVLSGEAEYVVRFDQDGARCTCAWFARHRGERGPCKHVLAAEHARRRVGVA